MSKAIRGVSPVPLLAILAFGSVAAGCSMLSPREDPSRFFHLTSAPGESPTPPASIDAERGSIGIGPLELPRYLAGPLLVTRIDDNEVQISEFERWAEPLDDNFLRVLVENLSGQLETRVVVFPPLLSEPVRFRVPIDVGRFERDSTGAVELRARWRVEDTATGEAVAYGTSEILQPSLGADDEAAVSALSGALASLSREIATTIRRVETP